jgi:outer membrane receptor protein involved in Fe transport
MKRFFMMWMLICLGKIAHGQVLTILDDVTGQPVELAIVMSNKHMTGELTNEQGQLNISSFSDAEWILIRSLGYHSMTTSFAELQNQKFIARLKSEDISLDQVVVSATRWNQGSRDVPSKVTAISKHTITLQEPQTSADLLGASGEVFIQKSQQGGGSPMIRGFATNRLLFAVDGVRMNTAIFRSGNIQNVINLDPFATERVEILFGPGSVMYGSDAIGGVMSFQTLTPQFSLNDEPLISGSAAIRTSTANNELSGHFDVKAGWKKWAMVSSISSFHFDDLRMGTYGPDEYLRPFFVERIDSLDVVVTNPDQHVQVPSGYDQINFMQKVRYKASETLDIEYALHYSTTTEYSRYDRHIRYRNGLPRYAEWNYGPQQWMMNQVSVHHRGYNTLYDEMTLRGAFQHFEESRIDRNINDVERHIRIEKVDANSVNFDFTKSLGKHRLFYGLEGVWDDVTSIGKDEDISTGDIVDGPSRYPQSDWRSYGIYANYQHHLNDQLVIQAGARYGVFGLNGVFDTTFYPFPYTTMEINDAALTGSLGATYSPSDRLSLRVNASTGFRAPNVDDAGKVFDSEPGSVIVPNPDLNAEYAYNFEAGVATRIGDHMSVDLTGFYTILENAMVRREYTLNGMDSIFYDGELSQVQAIQNAAQATVYGLQAGLDARWPSGFGCSVDLNFQIGEEELDDGTTSPLRHAAPFFGTARLSYRHEALELMLYGLYNAQVNYDDLPEEEKSKTEIYAVDGNGNPYSPTWATLNFKANYRLNELFTIGAGLENITDVLYRPYSSGMAGAGRNFILSLHADF